MNSPLRLIAALAACFLLASCETLPRPGIALPKPLPAELGVRCPEPPPAPPLTGEVDPVAKALHGMYDLYGLCAGKVVERIEWDEREGLR